LFSLAHSASQDKERTINDGTLIVVVKIGECGRPFRITGGEDETELFNEVVPPGDAVIMTKEANLATKHGVPMLKTPTGASGSIVLRSIGAPGDEIRWGDLQRMLAKKEQQRVAKRELAIKERQRLLKREREEVSE